MFQDLLRCWSLVWVHLKHLKNQCFAFKAQVGHVQINLGQVTFHVFNKNFLIIITAKQVAAGHQIEKDSADTEYVTFLIIPSSIKNFRCNIAGRATLLIYQILFVRLGFIHRWHEASKSEICNFNIVRLSIFHFFN
jgi:hypothetical protein